MSSKLEPTIWSCDTGQWIPCFGRCQLTIMWMSNIKDVRCKLAGVWPPRGGCWPWWALNLSLQYGHTILVTLAYMETCMYVQSYNGDQTHIFLHNGLPHFLTLGALHVFLIWCLSRPEPVLTLSINCTIWKDTIQYETPISALSRRTH